MNDYAGGIRHDYKHTPGRDNQAAPPRWPWFVAGVLPPILVVLFMVFGSGEAPVIPPAANPIASAEATAPGLLDLPDDAAVAEPETVLPELPSFEDFEQLTLVVGSGDSLDRLFRRHDLSITDLAAMVDLDEAKPYLVRLQPGDEIDVAHDDGNVMRFARNVSRIRTMTVTRSEDSFVVGFADDPVETRTVGAHGTIRSSLFEAGQEAGISDAVIMEMAGIFQWDIDFIQDVRIDDTFTVIYEELWSEGQKLQNGAITAAEFNNQGRLYRAARYANPDGEVGYFTPEGHSVRKAFLRAPVDFSRISSNFNLNRRHPVLNKIRAHRGVDYAAGTGTPIRASGDGKVSFRGANGGYGNTVVLQHGGNITTLYAHMSKFAEPRVGSRVKQGQIIGYVGQSGLATGPHLHYEYRINGVHRNPRTVPLPPADPVPQEHLTDFETIAAALWHQLDLYRSTQLAAASN